MNKREKEETEEEKKKRKEENRISFDYSKPLDRYDEEGDHGANNLNYLKEIVDISDSGPLKRPKFTINSYKLKDIFNKEETVKENEKVSVYPKVPKDYDPYKRMKEYSEKRGVKVAAGDEQVHKLSIQQRSKMLGERNPIEFRRPLNEDFVKEEPAHKETGEF